MQAHQAAIIFVMPETHATRILASVTSSQSNETGIDQYSEVAELRGGVRPTRRRRSRYARNVPAIPREPFRIQQ